VYDIEAHCLETASIEQFHVLSLGRCSSLAEDQDCADWHALAHPSTYRAAKTVATRALPIPPSNEYFCPDQPNTKARFSQEIGQRTPGIVTDRHGPPSRWKGPAGNLPDASLMRMDRPFSFLFDFEAPSKQRGTKDTNVAPDV
jgi:hypothetical protein